MQNPQTPLRAVRLANGLTLNQVAEAIQLDVGNLSRIERGIQIASLDVAERLSNFFKGKITEMQILYPKRFPVTGEIVSEKIKGLTTTPDHMR